MQATLTAPPQTRQFTISLETVAYLVLILLALTFRLAELDSVPMTVSEAPHALAAWRSVAPQVDLPAAPTESPAVFWAQRNSFMVFGSTEFAARILTALAGVALCLSPLLFRPLLGRTRAFMLALMLTFSPVLLIASRFSGASIWSLLFAVSGLWALWRYRQNSGQSYGVAAVVLFLMLLFFSEPGGILLGVMLFGAGLIALPLALEEEDNSLEFSREQLRGFPLSNGVILGAGVIAALATGLMTYPAGLNGVGELVAGFFGGFTQRGDSASPLVISLFYEPVLWGFAIAGIVLMVRRQETSALERFLIVWLGAGVVISLVYVGAEAAHALWLTFPLAALASYTAANLFPDDRDQGFWTDITPDEDINALYTVRAGRWLLSIVALALIAMLVMHLQEIGRALVQSNGDFFARIGDGAWANTRVSLLWVLITAVFLLVGSFLAASIWGNQTTLQALGLGLLAFMLINGLASGWSASVFDADQPAELWHPQSTSEQTPFLRGMLLDFAKRESKGYLEIPLTVVIDDAAGLTRDGVVAWQVRDFENVEFVESVAAARAKEIVMMIAVQPAGADQPPAELPDLGGDYVGRDFVVLRDWDTRLFRIEDVLALWFQRRLRAAPQASQTVTLWVRQDIYESQPFGE